jgi:cobyrinic acid a,c-diamide synthase
MRYARLIIAGTQSGVGKTTATLALLAALKARGRRVQAFKVGPDFIDPGHHAAITGQPSRNLDSWMLGATMSREIFLRPATDTDISIIEGMMGLFDGSSPVSEEGSTAEIAKHLRAPVLLVIDGSAIARSVAAMVLGYARFDAGVRVAGVLFNRVSGQRHYQLLKEAVEAHTDLSVVGYLGADPTVTIVDRHLGLTMAIEQSDRELYRRLADSAAKTVDLDLVETLAASAEEIDIPSSMENRLPPASALPSVRVGVADDAAFCFYYAENLELLEAEGAELVRFSPIKDHFLPEVDLLYLGGGYPELHGPALARNTAMRTAIRTFAERGGAIYAECGGMMYLTEAIRDFEGRSHDMVGLFPAEAIMRKPGLTLGYREIEIISGCVLGDAGVTARGHEFHYSSLVPRGELHRACLLRDARGEPRGPDGLVAGNALALYTHLHFSSQPLLAKRLIASARADRRRMR